ncbi:WAT1-related protein [Platanthera guangdongensis]|uniref:WAT1-related protein n=1 Tax=Platanthera guangdongensis TaxID=2320717 RepID=A0ABR2M6J8_9ASPA
MSSPCGFSRATVILRNGGLYHFRATGRADPDPQIKIQKDLTATIMNCYYLACDILYTMPSSSIFIVAPLSIQCHKGIVLGGILMVGGLYSVLWGKNREDIECKSTMKNTSECIEDKDVTSGHDRA